MAGNFSHLGLAELSFLANLEISFWKGRYMTVTYDRYTGAAPLQRLFWEPFLSRGLRALS